MQTPGSPQSLSLMEDSLNRSLFPMEGKELVKNSSNYSLILMESEKEVENDSNQSFLPMESEKPLVYINNPQSSSMNGVLNDDNASPIDGFLPNEDMDVVESHKSEIFFPIEDRKQIDNTNGQQISMVDVQNAGKVNQIESLLPLDDMDIAESARIARILPSKLKKRIEIKKSHKHLSKPRDGVDNMVLLHHALKSRKNTKVPQYNRSKLIASLRPANEDNRESGSAIKFEQPKANFDTPAEKFEKFPNLIAANHKKDFKQMILKINERGGATTAHLLLGDNAPMNYYPG